MLCIHASPSIDVDVKEIVSYHHKGGILSGVDMESEVVAYD